MYLRRALVSLVILFGAPLVILALFSRDSINQYLEYQSYYELKKIAGLYDESSSKTNNPLEQDSSEFVLNTLDVEKTEIKEKESNSPIEFVPNVNNIYNLINLYRQSNILEQLSVNPLLEQSTRAKVDQIIQTDDFSHNNSWNIVDQSGYDYQFIGENLAINYFSENAVINGWKSSPSHNSVLLDPKYTQMGVSYSCQVTVAGYENTCIYVLQTGKPL